MVVLVRAMVDKEWIVEPTEASQRLGSFIHAKLEGKVSAKQVKRWIEENRCRINGKTERFASTQIGKGDRVAFNLPSEAKQKQSGTILFQDDDVLVFNKPPGETSEALLKRLGREYPGIGLVHRLDKDTSGVVIFSLHQQSKKALENLFRHREIFKTYLALVNGQPKDDRGIIQSYLAKLHSYQGQTVYGSVPEDQGGLYAETSWECLKRSKDVSLIACYPKTGRTHQLRVHLKELGTPILGDFQYARDQKSKLRPLRQMLHAWKLKFADYEFTAPPPEDFLQCGISLCCSELG